MRDRNTWAHNPSRRQIENCADAARAGAVVSDGERDSVVGFRGMDGDLRWGPLTGVVQQAAGHFVEVFALDADFVSGNRAEFFPSAGVVPATLVAVATFACWLPAFDSSIFPACGRNSLCG